MGCLLTLEAAALAGPTEATPGTPCKAGSHELPACIRARREDGSHVTLRFESLNAAEGDDAKTVASSLPIESNEFTVEVNLVAS